LDGDDSCIGAALMGGRFDKFVLEMSNGKTMEFGRNKYDVVSRGGKGHEAVKRLSFVRVVSPPIELVDWDVVEGKPPPKPRAEKPEEKPTANGDGGTLF